jgi:hypothetical protein
MKQKPSRTFYQQVKFIIHVKEQYEKGRFIKPIEMTGKHLYL